MQVYDNEQVVEWAQSYELSHAVLSDIGGQVGQRFEDDYAIPSWTLLEPGLKVRFRDIRVDSYDIEAVLPR